MRLFSRYSYFERKKVKIGEQAAYLAGIPESLIEDFYIEVIYPKPEFAHATGEELAEELGSLNEEKKLKLVEIDPSKFMSLSRKVQEVVGRELYNS